MADGTDEHDEFELDLTIEEFSSSTPTTEPENAEADVDPGEPTSYHSGRVRIIGAEPAGDAVREVTGPVEEGHPELPHWNDAPTGQVPAILDRSNGEEQRLAPPTWREEDNDWSAQEDVFEPSMLSDDLPAVGALLNEPREEADDERQPWHFESDDTLVIPPEPELRAQSSPTLRHRFPNRPPTRTRSRPRTGSGPDRAAGCRRPGASVRTAARRSTHASPSRPPGPKRHPRSRHRPTDSQARASTRRPAWRPAEARP